MKKFNLEIKPAISVELRHKIADLLEKEGYNVWGQGEFTDKSVCDICFECPDQAETIKCDLCNNPAHGIYKKKHNKLIRCWDCAPPLKIITGFKCLNTHLKTGPI